MASEPSEGGLWLGLLRGLGKLLLRLPPLFAWLLVLAWAALIWRLSSQEFEPTEPGFLLGTLSNLAHAPLFGILTLLLAAAWLRAPVADWPETGPGRLAPILGASFVYALADEWHQSLTPGRDSSALDVTTDLVAALCTLGIIVYLGRAHASERGLRGRLLLGCAVCVLCAAASTLL